MRADGVPVYRFEQRPGAPAVSVRHLAPETDGAGQLPDHRHAHDFLVLLYVEAGSGSLRVDGDRRAMRAGEVHAVPPGRVIEAPDIVDARCRASAVAFTPDAVPALATVSPLSWAHHPLFAMFLPDAEPGQVAASDRPRWSAWFGDLDEELADPGRLGAHEVVAGLLTRILVAAARLAPEAPAAPDPLVERVFAEIEATYREQLTVADVARTLGYTPGHLTTVVRERTGRPLLEWITERRMTEVRRLLRETELPLGVIAAQTGLRDASYLVRRFRARYGITPERWRRGQR